LGLVLVEPVLLFHKFLEEWAASVFGTVFPDLAQGTCRNEFGFESDGALPRAVLTRTVATDWQGLATGSHVVKLLAPCALRRYGPSLIGFNDNFDVELSEFKNLVALRDVF
jgi:hypothetical protein